MQYLLDEFSGPDHWNNPDMLEVGNGKLTIEESKAQLSLWSMLSAPLMAGNDLRDMDESIRDLLTNKEIISIDQDSLGISAKKSIDDGEFEVFVKPLTDDELSVCFFNREDFKVDIEFDWEQLAFEKSYQIRDLWNHKSLGVTTNELKMEIPAHGVIHVRLHPAQ